MTAAPRHVYLDLGTNWGDTLDLYRKGLADGAHANATNWEVYGFEAAPLLMPYVDQLVRWKNGVPGVERPVTCFPPAGSTKDRIRFAKLVGCWRTWAPKINFCLDPLPLRFGSARARPRPAKPHDGLAAAARGTRAPGCNGRRRSLHLRSCSGGWAHGHHLLLAQAHIRRRQLSSHVRVSKREHGPPRGGRGLEHRDV